MEAKGWDKFVIYSLQCRSKLAARALGGSMVNAVLVQGSHSEYDDQPGVAYHFPKKYLRRMEETVGDWVVLYTPVKDTGVSKESRGAYFAVAQVSSVVPDPDKPDHYYAYYRQGSFADFATPVKRMIGDRFLEPGLAGEGGKANSGLSQNAVRPVPFDAFREIIELGWKEIEIELPRYDEVPEAATGFAEEAEPYYFDVERKVVPELVNRKVRDERFRGTVLKAYDKRCAITGWQFVNGGGRAEVQGAHIKPVQFGGPDKIDNGLALSGTVHWMFDRRFLTIGEDDTILISHKVNNQDDVRRIINPTGKLLRPKRREHHPHPAFLNWHREQFLRAA